MEQLEQLAAQRLDEFDSLNKLLQELTEFLRESKQQTSPDEKNVHQVQVILDEKRLNFLKSKLNRGLFMSRKAEHIRESQEKEIMETFYHIQNLSAEYKKSFEQMSLRVMKRINTSFQFIESQLDGRIKTIANLYISFFASINQKRQAIEIERIFANSLCNKFSFVCLLLNWLVEVTRKLLRDIAVKYKTTLLEHQELAETFNQRSNVGAPLKPRAGSLSQPQRIETTNYSCQYQDSKKREQQQQQQQQLQPINSLIPQNVFFPIGNGSYGPTKSEKLVIQTLLSDIGQKNIIMPSQQCPTPSSNFNNDEQEQLAPQGRREATQFLNKYPGLGIKNPSGKESPSPAISNVNFQYYACTKANSNNLSFGTNTTITTPNNNSTPLMLGIMCQYYGKTTLSQQNQKSFDNSRQTAFLEFQNAKLFKLVQVSNINQNNSNNNNSWNPSTVMSFNGGNVNSINTPVAIKDMISNFFPVIIREYRQSNQIINDIDMTYLLLNKGKKGFPNGREWLELNYLCVLKAFVAKNSFVKSTITDFSNKTVPLRVQEIIQKKAEQTNQEQEEANKNRSHQQSKNSSNEKNLRNIPEFKPICLNSQNIQLTCVEFRKQNQEIRQSGLRPASQIENIANKNDINQAEAKQQQQNGNLSLITPNKRTLNLSLMGRFMSSSESKTKQSPCKNNKNIQLLEKPRISQIETNFQPISESLCSPIGKIRHKNAFSPEQTEEDAFKIKQQQQLLGTNSNSNNLNTVKQRNMQLLDIENLHTTPTQIKSSNRMRTTQNSANNNISRRSPEIVSQQTISVSIKDKPAFKKIEIEEINGNVSQQYRCELIQQFTDSIQSPLQFNQMNSSKKEESAQKRRGRSPLLSKTLLRPENIKVQQAINKIEKLTPLKDLIYAYYSLPKQVSSKQSDKPDRSAKLSQNFDCSRFLTPIVMHSQSFKDESDEKNISCPELESPQKCKKEESKRKEKQQIQSSTLSENNESLNNSKNSQFFQALRTPIPNSIMKNILRSSAEQQGMGKYAWEKQDQGQNALRYSSEQCVFKGQLGDSEEKTTVNLQKQVILPELKSEKQQNCSPASSKATSFQFQNQLKQKIMNALNISTDDRRVLQKKQKQQQSVRPYSNNLDCINSPSFLFSSPAQSKLSDKEINSLMLSSPKPFLTKIDSFQNTTEFN